MKKAELEELIKDCLLDIEGNTPEIVNQMMHECGVAETFQYVVLLETNGRSHVFTKRKRIFLESTY